MNGGLPPHCQSVTVRACDRANISRPWADTEGDVTDPKPQLHAVPEPTEPNATRDLDALLRGLRRVTGDLVEATHTLERERDRLRRISEAHAFQTRLLEAVANGVAVLDAQHRIASFNRAAERTFGVAAESVVHRDARTLEPLMPELPEMLETYYGSGSVHLRAEIEGRTASGETLTLEIRLAPVEGIDGSSDTVLLVSDVTSQRALEAAHAKDLERSKTIESAFSRYLAPHVVKQLVHDPAALKPHSERVRATMLFADIRGFTALAATLEPERVAEILNGYFEAAARAVFDEDGLLDKFYGDGVMAVFGPPLATPRDSGRAIRAALRLMQSVEDVRRRVRQPFQVAVGIATGDVVAGHFGSAQRMDYTVVGDAVNLANGLQAAAGPGEIFCDALTYESCGIPLRAAQTTALIKGREKPVRIYRLLL